MNRQELIELMGRASDFKEGDLSTGVGTDSASRWTGSVKTGIVLLICALGIATSNVYGQADRQIDFTEDFAKCANAKPASPAWLAQTSTWIVRDNVYEQTRPEFRGTCSWLTKRVFSDFAFSVRFKILSKGSGVRAAGMIFRSQSSRDQCFAHFDSKYSQLIVYRSGRGKKLAELARVRRLELPTDVWHKGRIVCAGSDIKVFLNGKQVASIKNDTFLCGRIGLRAGQGHVLFDDVKVQGTLGELRRPWKMEPESRMDDEFNVPQLTEAERIEAVTGQGYFPVLIKLDDGSLGAVIRGGAPHLGIQGRLDWIHSEDGGRTWSKPTVIVDSQWDDRNPALGQMPDGTVVMAYAEASTYDPQGKFDGEYGTYEMFYVLSADRGKTWSEKIAPPHGPIKSGSPFGRIVLLTDGTALMPVYGSLDPDYKGPIKAPKGTRRMTLIVRSKDNGRTWGDRSLVAVDHNEMSLLPLPDGRIIAGLRTGSGALSVAESSDGGRTWSEPEPLTRRNHHPCDLCLLESSRIVLAFGNRIVPYGVGATVSGDGGRTWDYDHRALLAATSMNRDCGYPSLVQLDDGTLVMMYYSVGTQEKPSEKMALAVRFTEQALLRAMGKRD